MFEPEKWLKNFAQNDGSNTACMVPAICRSPQDYQKWEQTPYSEFHFLLLSPHFWISKFGHLCIVPHFPITTKITFPQCKNWLFQRKPLGLATLGRLYGRCARGSYNHILLGYCLGRGVRVQGWCECLTTQEQCGLLGSWFSLTKQL